MYTRIDVSTKPASKAQYTRTVEILLLRGFLRTYVGNVTVAYDKNTGGRNITVTVIKPKKG